MPRDLHPEDVPRRFRRREFLGAGVTAGLAALGLSRKARAGACETTSFDILGPYYVQDAPMRTVIASEDEPGTRLFIQGRVFANDCTTPLPGTIVDIWHANIDGCYSVLENCPDEDPFNLRGQFLTDENGFYAYETVLPGYYTGRCRHVHYRLAPAAHPILVTQLYFEGDPRIPTDPFASQPQAENRIIPLTEDVDGLHGVFDLTMRVAATDVDDPEDAFPSVLHFYAPFPNPFHADATLRWSMPRESRTTLVVYDIEGRRVRMLDDSRRDVGYHTVLWDGRDDDGARVAVGVYFVRLSTLGTARTQRVIKTR